MNAARNWLSWTRKAPSMAWTLAVIGTASAGLFLGSDYTAHSDISKFSALLSKHERVPGEVVVKLSKAGQFAMQTQSMEQVFDISRFRVSAIDAFETDNSFYLVKLNGDAQTAQFLEATSSNPAIAYAEPNYILRANGAEDEVIPNDAQFSKLWGLKNTGEKGVADGPGLAGADIGAAKAWKTTTGNKDVIVAVIDTGVDYTHPDLVDNIYKNPGEAGAGKETNGIDDDGNGFVDDFRGWNFAGVSTNNPMDDNEHGTHVAGTIAGKGNNGLGVAGVNWESSILPVKFLTGGGSGTLADAVKSIQYVTTMKAHMSNNSWGGGGFTQSMFDAIADAKAKGILFIAAAGNDGQNSDNSPHYPAGYQLDNVIAVAATTNLDTLASFSTYGKRTVHIAAPGHKIYSTVPGGSYDTFSGTSMASPHVAGAAALLWGTDTSMTYAQVKDRLLRSRDFVAGMARKVASSGRLNVYNAINGIYPPSPEPAESDWRDAQLNGPIESAHPYADNAKQEWTVEGPANAKFVRVVLSRVELEDGYDFLKVYDANGNEVDSMSGKGENVASFYVPGNKLVLKFSSDSSETRWGFAVGKLQVVY
jgi:thermitase